MIQMFWHQIYLMILKHVESDWIAAYLNQEECCYVHIVSGIVLGSRKMNKLQHKKLAPTERILSVAHT